MIRNEGEVLITQLPGTRGGLRFNLNAKIKSLTIELDKKLGF